MQIFQMVNISEVLIREIEKKEFVVLEDLLYEAIFQPDMMNPIPRSVIDIPEVRVYIKDFSQKKDDYCLVALSNGQIIGSVWVRILADDIKGFGNIDDKTPEFVISVFKKFQNQGVGKLLMAEMISYLRKNGYSQASLSVQKENYAVKMYKNFGFKIVKKNNEDYIMLLNLVDEISHSTKSIR